MDNNSNNSVIGNNNRRNNGSRGNQRNGNNRRNNQNNNRSQRSNQKEFKGDCDDLKGKVYFIGNMKQADNYNNTTEAILSYIQRTYDYGNDIMDALDELEDKDFAALMPKKAALGDKATDDEKEVAVMILKSEVQKFVERKQKYTNNMHKAYALILGQCTKALKGKLESRKDWENGIKNNAINLLKALKEITYNYQDNKYPMESIYFAIKNVFTMKQEEQESIAQYTKRFNNCKDIMETQHGKLKMEKYVSRLPGYAFMSTIQQENAADEQYNKLMAFAYLKSLDQKRCGKLVEDLSNQYALGDEKFPTTIAKATETVVSYKNKVNNPGQARGNGRGNGNRNGPNNGTGNNNNGNENGNSSFGQTGNTNNRNNNRLANIRCYNCGRMGHYANNCPELQNNGNTNGTSNAQDQCTPVPSGNNNSNSTSTSNSNSNSNSNNQENAFSNVQVGSIEHHERVFSQAETAEIMKHWILLDNCSTTDIFCDQNVLGTITPETTTLNLRTNGGILQSNKKGFLPNYGKVWYDPRAITNILSLFNVKKKHRVVYDSAKDDKFKVYVKGRVLEFIPSQNGLYYYDNSKNDFCMLDTVEENQAFYTPREVERAKKARKLYQTIGTPSVKDFKALLRMNVIQNCPVTEKDVDIAEKVFGKDITTLKGKSVRTRPVPVVQDYIGIPPELKQQHREVDLCADIMFIQGLAFLTTISKRITYRTIEFIPHRSATALNTAFDTVFRIYNKAGFVISNLFVDPEFKFLEDTMTDIDINMNYCSAQEHVPEIERSIRVIKERFRSMYHRLPYQCMPKIMIKHGAMECVRWLNTFPPKNGISTYYSPRVIMAGKPLDYNKHCTTAFGSYVQALQENTPTNTTAPRTIGCIYLRSLDTLQGGYELLNLNTNKVITRRKITTIPITQTVIDRVEALAAADNMKPDLVFKNRKGDLLQDDDFLAGVDDNNTQEDNNTNEKNEEMIENETTDDEDDINKEEEEELLELRNEETAGVRANNSAEDDESTGVQNDNDEPIVVNEDHPPAVSSDDDTTETTETARRSARIPKPVQQYEPSMKGQSYEDSHFITQMIDRAEYDNEYALLIARTITELQHRKLNEKNGKSFAETYTLKTGIKKFGTRGYNAAYNEVKQLHQRDCFVPVKIGKLSKEERSRALESLIFLTEKRDGRIKGRTCADGRKQRLWMDKTDTASPTVLLESVLLTSIIDAKENRDVATIDIPNAFVQTEMGDEEETVYMKMRGKLAEILVQVSPEIYRDFIAIENGKKVLYVKLQRALYGMLKSALLFYKKLRKDLESLGFKINPYDPCVANKIENGKQLTIVWHVDDLKISHVESKVVDNVIKWLKGKYEDKEIGKMTVSRGKVHDYLAMGLDFSVPGEVRIRMENYVKEMIESFPDGIEGTSASPAADHLFQVNENGVLLDEKRAEVFHTIVAKGLFLCKRARGDIMTTIAFLCTRVQKPDEDDWKKLVRLLKYLNGTRDLYTTLKADETNVVKWYGDAAFAVHPNMRSHTGGMMTMGQGGVINISTKQKLNTKSSTEAELVGADDLANQILWTNYFLEAQDYDVKETVLYQDNKSTMLLLNNGKGSSTKRTRHLNIRYFFLCDRIANNDLKVEYCPTDEMIADYFSKPLQGMKFKKFRKAIMNL